MRREGDKEQELVSVFMQVELSLVYDVRGFMFYRSLFLLPHVIKKNKTTPLNYQTTVALKLTHGPIRPASPQNPRQRTAGVSDVCLNQCGVNFKVRPLLKRKRRHKLNN